MIIGCIWKKSKFLGFMMISESPRILGFLQADLARLIQLLKVVLHADWADPLMRTKKIRHVKKLGPYSSTQQNSCHKYAKVNISLLLPLPACSFGWWLTAGVGLF
jgi:hypothetical protein